MYKLHVVYLFIVKKQETSSKIDLLDGVEDTHAGLYITDGIFVASSLMNQQWALTQQTRCRFDVGPHSTMAQH